MSVHVDVDVYSGRPNPGWDLSAADAARFFERFDALMPLRPEAGSLSPGPEGLGYRGLKIDIRRGSLPMQMAISGGAVQVQAESGNRRLADPERALEKWLLQTGKGPLGADLLDYLLREASK